MTVSVHDALTPARRYLCSTPQPQHDGIRTRRQKQSKTKSANKAPEPKQEGISSHQLHADAIDKTGNFPPKIVPCDAKRTRMADTSDIQLTPTEQRQFRDALIEAYDPQRIEQALLFWGSRKLHQYVSVNADLREIVFELMMESSREGWLGELIVYTYCEMPAHPAIRAFFGGIRPRVLFGRNDLEKLVNEVEAPVKKQTPRTTTQDSIEPARLQKSDADFIEIPAGPFWMGMRPGDFKTLEIDIEKHEVPRYEVFLSTYKMARHQVTQAQYQLFIQETGYKPPMDWDGGAYPDGKADHPVVNVSFEDADAYCRWLSDKTGQHHRLPTEAEWEKAARGDDGRFYPWGSAWKPKLLNSREARQHGTTPVGLFSSAGDSPYGLADMAGNVREWCSNFYAADTYDDHENARDPRGPALGTYRTLRGGSFQDNRRTCRCTTRFFEYPYFSGNYVGFRVVM